MMFAEKGWDGNGQHEKKIMKKNVLTRVQTLDKKTCRMV
jgi:hypothetical protein